MTRHEEAVFNKKAEKHFKSHPELPSGKTIWFNKTWDSKANKKYIDNYDNIFRRK